MPMLRPLAAVVAFVVVALCAVVVHDRTFPKPLLNAANDFTTFYCAGTLVRERQNPYRVEPLRACEHRLGEFPAPQHAAWEVVPSPFPGYAMALYAAMSLLPYGAAHLAWLGLLLLGTGLTAVVLARLTGFALLPVLAITGVLIGFWNIGTAEPTPVVAALLATAALCASRGAWRAAGAATALAMIMPQFTLPAFVALLVFAPRARVAILVTAAALGVLSLVTLGFATNVEYFTATLPAQTRAEVFFTFQYSLTHLLAIAHAPVPLAIAAGQVSYLALLALGVWAGARLARASAEPACLVLVPAAVASAGGAYSHSVQILSGVGAALLVASLRSVPGALAGIPLVLYSVIWMADASWRGLLVATSVSAVAALWLATSRIRAMSRRDVADAPRRVHAATPQRWLAVAVGALVLASGFAALQRVPTKSANVSIAAVPPPAIGPLDQTSRVFQYRTEETAWRAVDARTELGKIPLVAGVLLLAVCAFAAVPRGADQRSAGSAAGLGASSRTIV